MQNRSLEVGVGLFLIAGLLALLVLALRVSGLGFTSTEGTYRLYAYFDNSVGIRPNARVALAGVTIGKVSGIELDHKTFTSRVTLDIDKDIDFLPVDSTAAVLTSGLLGDRYIGISIGGDDTVLKDGGVIRDTQSSLVLEDLIGKFLMNMSNKNDQKESN